MSNLRATVCALASLGVGGVWAQDRGVTPGAQDLPQIQTTDEASRESGLTLPTPTESGLPPIPQGPTVVLSGVAFDGLTSVAPEDLAEIAAPFLQRPLDAAGLEALRLAVTRALIDRGYVNSGALIPRQTLQGGVLILQIVEGGLSEIEVATNRYLWRKSLIQGPVSRASDSPPLAIDDVNSAFRALLRDPLVERLEGKLRPGDELGEAMLDLEAQLADPVDLSFRLDNANPPSVGEITGGVSLGLNSVAGLGERMGFGYARSDEAETYLGDVFLPITTRGLGLFGGFQLSESTFIEEPIASAGDIDSEFSNFELGLRQRLIRNARWIAAVSGSLSRRRSQTTVAGFPTPLAEGAEDDGEAIATVVRAAADARYETERLAAAARAQVSVGVDLFDATINPIGADGRFVSYLLQGQFTAKPFREGALEDLNVILRGRAQYTTSRLFPIERFAVGGAYTVRGYRQNTLVRDNGYAASIELRQPIFRVGIPGLVSRQNAGPVTLAAFFDVGGADNVNDPTTTFETLASVGGGLLWRPTELISMSVYYAADLTDEPFPINDEKLQDRGVHFSIVFTPPVSKLFDLFDGD